MSRHPALTRAGDTTTTIREWTVTIAVWAIGLALSVSVLTAVFDMLFSR